MKKLKIALTGRLRVGKDYIANHCGGTIIGFSDPFYKIGEHLLGLGVEHKDTVPFLRTFYQTIGQWGRGEINKQYPLTMERANFTALVKKGAFSELCPEVNWDLWGTPEIWLDALLRRAEQSPATLIFVTNVRFKNEWERVKEEGFDHWHVLCSRHTYEERLREVGKSINDPSLRDTSEQFAGLLDNSVVNVLKTQPTGDKLKVVWNDTRPSPSERLQSLEEFKTRIENELIEPAFDYQPEPEPESDPGSVWQPEPIVEEPSPAASVDPAGTSSAQELRPDAAVARADSRDPAERRRARTAREANNDVLSDLRDAAASGVGAPENAGAGSDAGAGTGG